ncbi:hypothetical protein ACIRD2_10935 [Streptomyces sp. NPDC093595]
MPACPAAPSVAPAAPPGDAFHVPAAPPERGADQEKNNLEVV